MLKINKKITMLSMALAAFFMIVVAMFLGTETPTKAIANTAENTVNIYMEEGASVRKVNPTGIRFSTYVSETYASSEKSFGTLIIPETAYTGNILDINHDTENVLDIPQEVWTTSDVAGYKKFNAVLIDIPESFYGTTIYAMSYAKDGTSYEYVSEPQARSVAYVASVALNEGVTGDALWTYTKAVAQEITLDVTQATLMDNETLALTATTQPADHKAVWTSSNESVVTVDKNGIVTGVSHGTATITATFGNYSASCAVTVWPYSVGFESGIPANFITAKAGATTYALSNAQAKDGDYSLRIKGNSAGYGNVTFNVEYLDKVFADPHVLGLEMDVYSTATFTDFCYRGLNTNGFAADIAYDSEGLTAGEWKTIIYPRSAYENLSALGSSKYQLYFSSGVAFELYVDNMRPISGYIVSYDANGGSVENATTTLMVGDTYVLEAPIAPDSFANFVGWYLDGEEFPMAGTWMLEEDITLTAEWTYAQSFENGIPTDFTGTLRNTTVSQSNAQASDGSYSMLLHTTSSNGYGYTCISKDYLDKVFADSNVVALAIDVYSNVTFSDFAYRGFTTSSENNLPYAGKAGLTADTWTTVYYGRKAYEDSTSLTGTNYLFYYAPDVAGLDLYIDNMRPVTADELGIDFAEGGEISGEIYSLNGETLVTISGGVSNLIVYDGESTDGDGKSIRYKFWRRNPGSDIILPLEMMRLGASAYSYVAFDVKTAYDVSGALYYTNNTGTGTYKDIKAGEWTTLYCPINYYNLTLMDRTYIFRMPACAEYDDFFVCVDNIRFVDEKPAEYTITYDANGGSVENATTTLMVGDTYVLETPTAENFLTFEGWYLNGEEFPTAGTWTLEEDITLTAKWDNYQSFETGVPSDMIGLIRSGTSYSHSNAQASEGEYAMKLAGNSSGFGYIAFSDTYLDNVFADPNVTGLAMDVYSTTTFTDFRYRGFNASGTEGNVYYDGIGVEYDDTGLTAGEWKTVIFPRRAYEARDSLTGTVFDIYFNGGSGMELYVDNVRAIAEMQYMDLGDAYVVDNTGTTAFNVDADILRLQVDHQSVDLEDAGDLLVVPNSVLTVGEHNLVMTLPDNVELHATLMVYAVTEATAQATLTYGSQGYQTFNYANVTEIISGGQQLPFEYNAGNASVLIADAALIELLETANGQKQSGTVELVILTTGENYLLSIDIIVSGTATVLSGAAYENDYTFSSAGYSSVEYFTSKNLTNLSPEKLIEYKNSGLTVVHPGYDASVSATATALTVQTKTLLENAADVGLKVILEDYFLVNLSESTTGSLIGTTYADTEALDAAIWERLQIYCGYEAFYGVVLADEPYYNTFTAYGEVYQSIKRVCTANNVECYIHCNMLAGFAGYEALGASSDFSNNSARFNQYKAYLQKFLDETGADYVMYDLYPLTSSGLTGWGLFTLQAAAEVAKENDVDLNVVTQTCTIQSNFFGTDNTRIMSTEDLHWINNMLLGFGVKEIHYFTYYARPDTDSETYIDEGSFLTAEGEKTDVYYRMQAILAQNQQFASVIKSFDYVSSNLIKGASVTYNNTGVVNTTDSKREYSRAEEFDTDSFSGALTAVSADKEYVLLTKLSDGTNDMYMVQNAVDPQYDTVQTVTMTFTGKTYAVLYENGFKRIVKLDSNGTLTLKLSEGNAAYVTAF